MTDRGGRSVHGKGGRPTKLTSELQDLILSYLRTGNYIESAAAASGLASSTLRGWLQRGRRAKRGRYAEFLAAYEKARAEAEIAALGLITRAGMPRKVLDVLSASELAALPDETRRKLARLQVGGDWQALAWRLERTMPAKFGRRMELTGRDSEPLAPAGKLSPEEIAATVASLLGAARNGAGGTENAGAPPA